MRLVGGRGDEEGRGKGDIQGQDRKRYYRIYYFVC